MSQYQTLKTQIQQNIKQNGDGAIRGDILQTQLLDMINALGAGYQFMGVATPTNPRSVQTPDYKCFYLATTPGTYANLGGLAVADGEVAILKYDTSWTKEVTGAATADQLNQLGQEVDKITIEHTTNLWEQGDIDFTDYIIIGTAGVKLYDAGNYVLSFDYRSGPNVNIIVYGPNGQIASRTIAPSTNRVTYSIAATVQIERFFFQSTGNTISLKNVQLELGTVATPYVPPITVADFTARGSLVSHKEEQSLSDYAKALACNNIGAMGYAGSITYGVSLDDTSIKTGFYYLAAFSVTGSAGFLVVYNYSSKFIVQEVVDFLSGRIYTRSYEGASWKGWVEQKDFYSFYKGSLTQSDNINSLFSEGAYYCIGGQPSGDFPVETIGATCLLIVNGIQNFTEETIINLSANVSYKRTYISGAWTSWLRVITNDNIGLTSPNLLNNENTSFTKDGITFTVDQNKKVTISGTSTGGAYMSLPCVLPRGKYILSGTPTNSVWGTWYFLFVRGDGSYKEITNQYYPQGYIFEVTEETETVNAYIRVDKAGLTIPENTVFSPMIQRYPYRTMDYVPYGREQYRKPIFDLIDCTEFNWSGKKINVIGDSIVAGAAGNWVDFIASILGLSDARNYGIGGCRLAYYGDGQSVTADDSVVARYANMDNDADIIIVHAGTNDWASQVPLGNADSNNKLEFNGALNIIMSGLRTKYPTALIIFDAIMERVDYDAPTHGGVPMLILTSQYSECIKQRCDDHHFLFFDSYKEFGLDFTLDYTSGVCATTNDGLHPNMNGAKIIGRKLAAFIKGH